MSWTGGNGKWQENIRRYGAGVIFLPILVLAAVAMIYGGLAYPVRHAQLNREPVDSLSTGWYYMRGDTRVEVPSLPVTIRDDMPEGLTMYRSLPESLPRGAALCVESYHQTVEIFVGDIPIYAYGLESRGPVGWILGDIWNVAEVPDGAEGQLLSLRLTAPNTPGEWQVSDILWGTKSAIMQSLWTSCAGIAVYCLVMGILGLLLLLFALLLKWKRLDFNRRGFFTLGLFILLSTLWIFTDSKLPQFLTDNLAALYLLSFLSFTLLPIPFLFYLRQLTQHGKALLDILSLLFMIQALLSIGLYFAGIADFVQTLTVTHILLAAGIIGSVAICLLEWFRFHNRDAGPVLVGSCALALGALTSLLVYIVRSISDNSLFFRIGMIVFILLLCYDSFKRGLRFLRDSLEAETYRVMAFTDNLTGLGNRAAFDRDAEALPKQAQDAPLTVVMFDVNHLKRVNDTYGHAAGDYLIQSAARCIRDAFSALGSCYRIGGDEFVVLMRGASAKQAEEALARLAEYIARCDAGRADKLDVATGYAAGAIDGPEAVYRLFREADAKMYEQKGNRARA